MIWLLLPFMLHKRSAISEGAMAILAGVWSGPRVLANVALQLVVDVEALVTDS